MMDATLHPVWHVWETHPFPIDFQLPSSSSSGSPCPARRIAHLVAPLGGSHLFRAIDDGGAPLRGAVGGMLELGIAEAPGGLFLKRWQVRDPSFDHSKGLLDIR